MARPSSKTNSFKTKRGKQQDLHFRKWKNGFPPSLYYVLPFWRLEEGYQLFPVVYFSRGTLPTKKVGEKGT